METPPVNAQKLLDHWTEWEQGDLPPGELIKRLKVGGLPTLLEELAAGDQSGGETVGDVLGS